MSLDSFVYKLCTEGKNFAAVATVMPDGSPQVSLVWVDSDGEHIIINTAEGRLKTNNLRKDNRVAVAIANSNNHYEQAMIRGSVVQESHDGAEEHINSLAKKYLGLDEYPHRQPGEVRIKLKIKPDKVFKIEG
jgi:PPOX class probable F420-dependent enzyme